MRLPIPLPVETIAAAVRLAKVFARPVLVQVGGKVIGRMSPSGRFDDLTEDFKVAGVVISSLGQGGLFDGVSAKDEQARVAKELPKGNSGPR